MKAIPGWIYDQALREGFALLGTRRHLLRKWFGAPDATEATALWTAVATEFLFDDGLMLQEIRDEETGGIFFAVRVLPDLDDAPWGHEDDWSE